VCYVVGLSSLSKVKKYLFIFFCLGGGKGAMFLLCFCPLSREGNSGLHSTPSNYSSFYGMVTHIFALSRHNIAIATHKVTLSCQALFTCRVPPLVSQQTCGSCGRSPQPWHDYFSSPSVDAFVEIKNFPTPACTFTYRKNSNN